MWIWAAALIACHAPEPADETPLHAPSPAEAERVVVLADGSATTPTAAHAWPALLAANDDAVFPEWAGKSLGDRALLVQAASGTNWADLADGSAALCTCDVCDDPACLDLDDPAPTLIIVQLGAFDVLQMALNAILNPDLLADPTPELTAFDEHVGAALASLSDVAPGGRPVALAVVDVVDPSDGVGDLATLMQGFFPVDGLDGVTPEVALTVLDGTNATLAAQAEAAGATLVSAHDAYLGHGWHFEEPASPAYVEADPTLWLRSPVEPNTRGASELRRLVWTLLTGEAVDALPTALQPEGFAGMPVVPDNGWATAAVDAAVTAELDAGMANVASDPAAALGVPDEGMVALGVTGAYITLGFAAPGLDGDGDDLVVMEFGAGHGGTPEAYRVSVATTAGGPYTALGDGLGEQAFDLAGSGISGVVEVRVESLVTESGILHGPGSPFYPGPEIDAVGLVWPQGE